MPWSAWVLLVVAVGTGLTVELVHYRRGRSRRGDQGRGIADSDQGPDATDRGN